MGREKNNITRYEYIKELFSNEEKHIRSNLDHIFPPDVNDPTPTAKMEYFDEFAYREKKFNEKIQEQEKEEAL